MSNRFFHIIVSLLGFWSCRGQAPATEIIVTGDPLPSEIDSFLRKKTDSAFRKADAPGLLIGVLYGDKERYYTAGYADPVNKIIFDSTTLFEAGSITKTFTAFVLTQVLMEKGISVNTPIGGFLPDSVRSNEQLGKITFLQLLNHTSGLPRLPDNMNLSSDQPYADYDSRALFEFLEKVTPVPTDRSEYSNLGYGLAGTLATIISGKTYSELVHDKILRPFGMSVDNSGQKKSVGHMENKPVEFWKFDALAGAGAIVCSASDMLKYLKNHIEPANDTIQQVVNAVTEVNAMAGRKMGVGLGWHIFNTKMVPLMYWHNGGTYGFSTYAAFHSDKKCAVIIVANKFDKNKVTDMLGMEIMARLRK